MERKIVLKKRTKGLIVGAIAVIALLFLVWPRESKNENLEVETASVTEQDFKEVVSTVGVVEPVKHEGLIGQGMITELNVEKDEKVEEDDVLVRYADGNELTAPFDGTVIELNVEEEEMDTNMEQNQPSLTLAQLDDLQVSIALSKSEANKVETDQEVELTYLDDHFTGKVTDIDTIAADSEAGMSEFSSQASQSSPTLEAIIEFDADDDLEDLIPGFDIDADIVITTTSDALAIPIESLLYDDSGSPYVFIVTDDDMLEKREVETGIQEGVLIEIKDGLTIEDDVVQLPSDDFEEGTEVSVISKDENDEQEKKETDDSEGSEDSDE